jgi:hypothetical protein
MPEVLFYLTLFGIVWFFPVILLLWLLTKTHLVRERVSLLKSFALISATLPAFYFAVIVWPGFLPRGSFVGELASLLLISVYFPFLVVKVLQTNPKRAAVYWLLCITVSYSCVAGYYKLLVPHPHYSRVTRINRDLDALAIKVRSYYDREGRLPIPTTMWNGPPIEGTLPEFSSAGIPSSASPDRLLYYRGLSLVPSEEIHSVLMSRIPTDPYHDQGGRDYRYAAGPITGPSAAALLSSPGPDGFSESERLEYLLLEKHLGDINAFGVDPEVMELTYSPTNGSESRGDIHRAVSVRRLIAEGW